MQNNVTHLHPLRAYQNAEVPDFVFLRVAKYFRERVQNTWQGGNIMRGRIPDASALHLSSNDYLSVSRHPAIQKAMLESIQRDGNGMLMSSVFLQGNCPQFQLESRLAKFMQAEAGVLCQSGFSANVGLLQAIANEHTPVYVDMMAHMSLWEGIKSAGAKMVTVFHNDSEHLERQILRHGPGIVLVDSVYSTTGCLAPLQEIIQICEAHGCVMVADESHALGTHGPKGEGLVVALGLADRVHFRTASLAKAFAGRAGFVTCSEKFCDFFRSESYHAIFSSTLLPHEVMGLDAALTVIKEEGWRRDKLHANAEYLRTHLDALGYNLNNSETQIVSLESGTEQQTIVLRDALETRGIFGSVFCAPATPKNRALMRFSVNADLTHADLQRIVHACRDMRDEVDLHNWPSSRRKLRHESMARASRPLPLGTTPQFAVA